MCHLIPLHNDRKLLRWSPANVGSRCAARNVVWAQGIGLSATFSLGLPRKRTRWRKGIIHCAFHVIAQLSVFVSVMVHYTVFYMGIHSFVIFAWQYFPGMLL